MNEDYYDGSGLLVLLIGIFLGLFMGIAISLVVF